MSPAAQASDVPLETEREGKPRSKKTTRADRLAHLSENFLIRAWVFIETFDAITWAANRHRRRRHLGTLIFAYVLRMKIHISEIVDGFVGDPSFYDLGIRLDVYLHWLAVLITAAYLKEEEEEEEPQCVVMAYLIFSISIHVALL